MCVPKKINQSFHDEQCMVSIQRVSQSLMTFNLLFSLKLECEKLASEKIEIQRHYVMVSIESAVKKLILLCMQCSQMTNSGNKLCAI